MSAEEAQHRVQTALSNFVDDIEKTKLRQMQVPPITFCLTWGTLKCVTFFKDKILSEVFIKKHEKKILNCFTLQRSMHFCAAECCSDSKASMNSVHSCVESCQRDITRAQEYVQSELAQFQDRLQRGVLLCQDRIKEKVGPNPSETEMKRFRGEFEECAVKCVDHHIGQLPTLMDKIKKGLNSWFEAVPNTFSI